MSNESNKQWAVVNGVSTCYEVAGHGPVTVVLLHEVGGSLASWDALVAPLGEHFRILRYDQRGAGQSAPARVSFNLEDLAEDLAQLLVAAQISAPCHLVGTAAGAAIALLFVARYPAWVSKLVLCCPATEVNEKRRAYLRERALLAEREGMSATLALSLANSYPPEAIGDRTVYESYKARFLTQNPTSYALMNRALMDVDVSSALTSLACPTLVLAGQHDRVRPPDEVAAFARRLPGARFAVLAGGHLLSVQAPALLRTALIDFLRDGEVDIHSQAGKDAE